MTAIGIKGVTTMPPMPIAQEVMNVVSRASSLGRCLGSGGIFIRISSYYNRGSISCIKVMAYGREMLRKAGSKLMDLDRQYADFAVKGMTNDDPRRKEYGTALGDIMGSDRAEYMRDQRGSWMGGDNSGEVVNAWSGERSASKPREDLGGMHHRMMDMVQMADNIGVRYGLPAAGVTLAGKGLYDMTAAFGNGADYPSERELPL